MKYSICLFFALVHFPLLAQQDYVINENIGYYSNSETSDAYTLQRCKLDIYYPKNVEDWPVIIWFHGGGLSAGNKYIPDGLKNKGVGVVSVNYRLYPKVKSPEYIRDAARSVAWVMENIESYGGDPSRIFISGHSAGGYLTSMIGLDKRWLNEWGKDADDIAGLIPLSGHTITHFTVRKERGIKDIQPVVDDLAPLYHVRENAPPLLLITGDRELELLGRYEENAFMMRMMKVAGHESTDLIELQGYGHLMEYPALPILLKFVKKQ